MSHDFFELDLVDGSFSEEKVADITKVFALMNCSVRGGKLANIILPHFIIRIAPVLVEQIKILVESYGIH